MTIDEAKTVFLNRGYVEVEGGTIYDADKWRESCRVISEWLEQESCEDAISREEVLNGLASIAKAKAKSDAQKSLMGRVMFFTEQLPSVKPQEKTGYWEMPVQDDGMSDPIYYQVRCSKCGFDLDPQTWHMELHQYGADKFCPYCGAKMEVEE